MEALKGDQHKIDKNKNNKIDAHDFKILRGEKKVNEEDKVEEGWDDMMKAAKERSGPKPSGDSGVKKGSRYGGSKQKDKPEHDDDKKKVAEAATMQPKGPARVDVPAYKRVNMKPLSLKDVVSKSTEKKSNQPNAVKEESEQVDEGDKTTLRKKLTNRIYGDEKSVTAHVKRNNLVDYRKDRNDTTKSMVQKGVHRMSSDDVKNHLKRHTREEVEHIDEALRTVSTHGKGEGQHHAVVKRDVEWNEYQVHYFKDGKHMGEGPVSHHDDKADAQSTADHEVKRMNAKSAKNEDFNLEDMDPTLVEEFMQTEEFEQLDELSKKTLGDYVKKASHDVAHKGAMTRQHANDSDAAKKDSRYNDARKSEDKANKTFAKSWSRRQGMAKAVDRLTKEESEQIDELSKETLKSYQDKALKSNPGTRRGYERIIGVARSAEKLKKKD
jgi:hypothetical protein